MLKLCKTFGVVLLASSAAKDRCCFAMLKVCKTRCGRKEESARCRMQEVVKKVDGA